MAFEALSEKPLRVEKMSVLDGIVWAFAPEYEHLMLALGGFEWINNIDKCNGVLLNRIGQLVCLTRLLEVQGLRQFVPLYTERDYRSNQNYLWSDRSCIQ